MLLLAIRDGKQRTDVEKAVVFVPVNQVYNIMVSFMDNYNNISVQFNFLIITIIIFFIFCQQESVDINGIVRQVSLPTPTVLIRDSAAVLVVERQILCSLPVKEVPLGLLAAFYVFNMEYPKGI